jgi:hypothetical protein
MTEFNERTTIEFIDSETDPNVVMPSSCRINGVPVILAREPIEVHVAPGEASTVRLTLLVSDLQVRGADDPPQALRFVTDIDDTFAQAVDTGSRRLDRRP